MLVAVTGAQGFLGNRTASALEAAGHRVRGLCRGLEGERTPPGSAVHEWIVGDLASPEALAALVSGTEAVIHIAIDWAALNEAPIANFERNLLGSLRLLEQARSSKVEQVLFVSTIDVYHEVVPGRAIDEAQPAWPGDVYGSLKAAIELHLKAYHHAYGMNTSAWRPATMYGVNPALERSHWFELITRVKERQAVETDQGGNFVSVEDVAEALTLAVGDRSVAGQFYNLVDGYVEWRQVAQIARELSGSDSTITGRPPAGSERRFSTAKAAAFFERHGNRRALRRGPDGIREYVGALLTARGMLLARKPPRRCRTMPEKKTLERAKKDKREGKSPSTQAGEFVREEIHHVREGKHGARSTKQAIAIGLSKARRAGVKLKPPKKGTVSRKTRASAARASKAGRKRGKKKVSPARSRAAKRVLKREGHSAASRPALAKQARSAAKKRTAADRSASARKAARTKGPAKRSEAARKAARTRARRTKR